MVDIAFYGIEEVLGTEQVKKPIDLLLKYLFYCVKDMTMTITIITYIKFNALGYLFSV